VASEQLIFANLQVRVGASAPPVRPLVMWEAADQVGADPDRVSFVAALRIARRSIPAARDFPPSGH